jgi:DHA2 family multidrug resistance protein
VLRGAAMGFLFVPLSLATLIGLKGREIAEGTGIFNLARQLGGSAGIAILSTFLDHRTTFHRNMLLERISVYNPLALQRLQALHDLDMAEKNLSISGYDVAAFLSHQAVESF